MAAYADDVAILAAQLEGIAQQARALAQAMKTNGWEPQELDEGLSTDLADANGVELHVGERVKVVGSDRYGETIGYVRGPGPDLGDGKQRVHVALENGENDTYTPSVGRVHVITEEEAAEAPA